MGPRQLGVAERRAVASGSQRPCALRQPPRLRVSSGSQIHTENEFIGSHLTPNAPVEIAVPEAVASAAPAAVTVASEKLADGVWFLAGGSHHSVLVEFEDHVAVIEAPLNPERSEAVMAEVEKLVPGKPLRYLVNTHHHFDHSGGVQTYAAKGVSIVTHEMNVAVLPGSLLGSARSRAWATTRASPTARGASRSITCKGTATTKVSSWCTCRRRRLLVQADAFSPRPGPAPSPVNPFSVNLHDNIVRLNLDVERIAPIHGTVVPLADLKTAIGDTDRLSLEPCRPPGRAFFCPNFHLTIYA